MGETEGFRTEAWWLFIEHYSLPHALFTSTELSVKQRETGGLFQITLTYMHAHTSHTQNIYIFIFRLYMPTEDASCLNVFLSTSECGLIDCITKHFVPFLHQHCPLVTWGYMRCNGGSRTAIYELQWSNYRCMWTKRVTQTERERGGPGTGLRVTSLHSMRSHRHISFEKKS